MTVAVVPQKGASLIPWIFQGLASFFFAVDGALEGDLWALYLTFYH